MSVARVILWEVIGEAARNADELPPGSRSAACAHPSDATLDRFMYSDDPEKLKQYWPEKRYINVELHSYGILGWTVGNVGACPICHRVYFSPSDKE